MRHLIVFALAGGAWLAASTPGHADTNYPWCLITSGRDGGAYSCGYVSRAQCMATRTGSESCVQNPQYRPGQPLFPGQTTRERRPARR